MPLEDTAPAPEAGRVIRPKSSSLLHPNRPITTPQKPTVEVDVASQQERQGILTTPAVNRELLELPIFSEEVVSGVPVSVHDQNSTLLDEALPMKSKTYDDEMAGAIIQGNESKTRELLANSYDVNCTNEHGTTPLLTAARYKHEHLVKLLLEQGALPGAKDSEGLTTLHRLSLLPRVPPTESLIDLLLQDYSSLDLGENKGNTPLMLAAARGETKLAMKLLKRGANVQAVNQQGFTALHRAA